MWNGTMFVDLDWPLNASSLLSASAELLVCFVFKAWKSDKSLIRVWFLEFPQIRFWNFKISITQNTVKCSVLVQQFWLYLFCYCYLFFIYSYLDLWLKSSLTFLKVLWKPEKNIYTGKGILKVMWKSLKYFLHTYI